MIRLLTAIFIHSFLLVPLLFCEMAEITIPKISQKVSLKDFERMVPRPEIAAEFAVVEGFIQSNPTDGSPSSQKTVVYLAYDDRNLYIIFVCFDTDSGGIRTGLTRREGFSGDEDWIEVYLDTYNDMRRAYCFSTNALGVQWDSRYSETATNEDSERHQPSFDALWYSEGKLTDQGYVVWMAIPFKSIRFPSNSVQKWRTLFGRSIPRNNEYAAWPHISRDIQGMLTQSAELNGLKNVSPGKSIQFIPYTSFRSFRLLNTDSTPAEFISEKADPDAGLDSKLVLKDSYVLDLTLNPDFSQVESDAPQITVNERFEVFFPEKRPFFLENAQYFETPMNLVFTRRIADPQYGTRLTGKQGPYTMGLLFANDQAPGKLVPDNDPIAGEDAYFGIFRFTRDIFSQSSIGALFTTRSFENSLNNVAGADFRLRFNDHWQASAQAVRSWATLLDESSLNGHAYKVNLERTGRQFNFALNYDDLSPDFRTLTGFIPRTDFRGVESTTYYRFRPEGKVIVSWGPEIFVLESWDYTGTRLDSSIGPTFYLEMQRRTFLRLNYSYDHQLLRPVDFPGLEENVDFETPKWNFEIETSYLKQGTIEFEYTVGKDINFDPPEGQIPDAADYRSVEASLVIKPVQKLQLVNTYLFTALNAVDGATILNDHIIRARANYQFTRELSLRLILQYEATLVNPSLTSLENRKNLNADVLITYLVNPWTALYIGYNGNRQNWSLIDDLEGARVIRTRGRLMNDANQFFFKFSYLLNF